MRFFLNNASRKILLLLNVVLFISGGLFGQAGLNQTNEYVPNRVIVKFKSGGDANEIVQFKAQLKSKLSVSKTMRWNKIDAEVWDFAGGDVLDIISRWKNDPRIKYIEPDYIVRASVVPNDPQYGTLWGMTKIQAAQAWDTTTGAAVIVGVIDSGVDYLHPDLAPNIWTNTGETPGNGIDDDNNGYIDDVHGYDFINNDGDPMDDNNHGTHCSGTIAGVGDNGIGVVGVNWTAKIMALKFLGASGFGNTSDAVTAVLYATAMGAKLTNNSWGGGAYSQALYDAINAAATANCLFVAAAGNSNSGLIEYPAGYDLDNIISVAATDINDARANFSNYGATWVDLGSPGVDILSTTRNNTYSSFDGTSMACPHVAGAAALIWARAPLLSWANVKDMILSSVDPVASLSGITVTGGRLNLFNAMVATGIYLRSADPVIAVSPPSVSFSILPDANSSSLLSISNTDVDAKKLDWNITSAPCSWLSINTLSGRVVGGGTQQIQFTANAFGMIPGNYQCTLNINSNDPVNPVVQVIVNLEVLYAPPPVASVSPPSISLALTIGQNADNIVTVSNIAGAGERSLHWSAAKQGSSAWLTLTNNSATTAAGASSEMHVLSNAAGLSAGVYNETINITTNDPNNVLIQIPIQLTVSSEPVSGQKIYTFGGNASTIRRANLDGSDAATPFTGLNRPVKGVVDVVNRKLYWSEIGPVRVKRADLDGSNNETLVTSITGAIVAMDLDVENNHIYFFHQVAGQVFRLSRANLDGSNLTTVGDVPGWNFSGLNIDHINNKLYWYMLGAGANGGHVETGIWRSNLDLTDKEHLVTPAADAGGGLTIDFAGGKMYWGESFPVDVIRTATLDGNNQADVLVGYEAGDVAIDPIHGKIYWTHQICVGFDCTYDTKRADLNGSNIQSLGLNGYRLALDLSGASQLTISDVTENEGQSGPTTYTFTVSLSVPAGPGGVTFDIATQNNTATTANNDYVQKSLTGQTIAAGNSTYTFDVLVNGDNTFEPDETFFVNITNVTGGIVSDGQGLGTITNDDCALPITSGISGTTSPCPNQTGVAYSVTNTVGSTYAWTISGGTQASGGNSNSITVNWGAAGPGNVSVVETNAASCIGAAVNLPVTIVPGVSAGSISSDVTVICQGRSVNISHTGSTGTNGFVVFQAGFVFASLGSADDVEAFLAAAAPGQYCIYVFSYLTTPTCGNFAGFTLEQVIDECFAGQCYDVTQPLCITVNSTATPTISAGGPTSFCAGGSVTLISSSATGSQWYKNGELLAGETNQTLIVTAPGTYTVIVTTGGCPSAESAGTVVTVNTTSTPLITAFYNNVYSPDDLSVCSGTTIQLSTVATYNSYSWSTGAATPTISVSPTVTTTYSVTVMDANGCSGTDQITITIIPDLTPPTITCPANITQDNDPDQCGAVVSFTATASDNCPGVSVSYSPASGTFFPAGTTTVTATATDAAGRTASCSFTVTVVDAQNPTVTCPANITQSLGSGSCSKQVTTPNPAIGDNCGIVKLTWTMAGATTGSSPVTGVNYVGTKTFKAGTTTITYTATDGAGNTSSCSFTVQLKETVKPNITCPGDKSVHADEGLCYRSQLNLGNPSVSDNCGVASVTNDAPSVFPVGVTWVTWTVTDHSGNTRTCKQKITVEEHQKPTIECPAGITASTGTSGCAVSITTPNPVYSDNCSVSKLTWTMTGATTGSSPTGGINFVGTKNFKPGVTIVKYTATDPSGNSRNCSFSVTVTDDQPPVVVCPPAQTRCKVSGNSYSIPVMTRSDNCGIASTKYIVTGATTRTGSGVNASGTFKLGTSTVTWTVTDVNGNISTCSTVVTILPANNCGNNRVGEDVVDPKLITVGDGVFGLTAYPNPAEHYFNVRVNGSGQPTVEIRMFDMQGKMVQQQRGAAGDTYRFGENMAAGMYILEARQGTETVRIKVIKQ